MTAIAVVNGNWGPLEKATVPVLDRGFLFADGIYEVMAVYQGRLFQADAHWQRMERSLREIEIANPHSQAQWLALVQRLIEENGGADAGNLMVYLQVTRGTPSRRGHAFPVPAVAPTVLGLCHPLPVLPPEARQNGVPIITLPDLRWHRCDIKSIALLPNLMAAQKASDSGCNEALLHRDGMVTEGASSNIWWVKDGSVGTTAEGPAILTGITRNVLLEALETAGIPVTQQAITLESLRQADEVWLTSTTREVLPVSCMDGQAVGSGRPGPMWKKADQLFQRAKSR